MAGATPIPVGTARTGGGPAIAAGDLLLVVQMQGADIDFNNDQRYGSGVGTAGTVGNTVPSTDRRATICGRECGREFFSRALSICSCHWTSCCRVGSDFQRFGEWLLYCQ